MHPAIRRSCVGSSRYSWGTTRDDEGAGRRIFVDNIQYGTTVDDLKGLFGPVENIEGIEIKNHFAFIQFKRPIAYTRALGKNQIMFKGKQLKVKPWHSDRSGDSARGRMRPGQRRNSGRPVSRSSADDASSSLAMDEDSYEDELPIQDYDAGMSDLSRQMLDDARQDFQEQQRRTSASRPSSSSANGQEDLPRDVALMLELVLEKKSASNLSLDQIRTISEYFRTTYSKIQASQTAQPSVVQSAPPYLSAQQVDQVGLGGSNFTQPRLEPLGPAPMRPVQNSSSDRLYSQPDVQDTTDENSSRAVVSKVDDPKFQALLRDVAKAIKS